MHTHSGNVVLYFVKYPEPGKVKTRLAKAVGDEEAAKRYERVAAANWRCLQILRSQGFDAAVVYDPPARGDQIREWLPGADHYLAQQGQDLGLRMSHAFRWAFESGRYRQVGVLGSDTLDLDSDCVKEGFLKLGYHDVVLGPARDGGYYFLGLKHPADELFLGIPWSTEEVLLTTIQKICEQTLDYDLIRQLEDMDDIGYCRHERKAS